MRAKRSAHMLALAALISCVTQAESQGAVATQANSVLSAQCGKHGNTPNLRIAGLFDRADSPDLAVGGPDVRTDPRYKTAPLDNSRIFFGERVIDNTYMEVASVQGNGSYCSGVLVAPNVVLTAGHCYCRGIRKWVVFGNGNVVEPRPKREAVFEVVRSVPMKSCSQSQAGGDIAILFLDRPPPYPPAKFAPIALIKAPQDITAFGFGLTECAKAGEKRMAGIRVVSPSCSGHIKGKSDAEYYGCVPGKELVAGIETLKRDTCQGDSGGPIYVQGKEGLLLAGLTARGVRQGSGKCGIGGVYEVLDQDARLWLQTNRVTLQVGN